MSSSRRKTFLLASSAKTILFTVCVAVILRALVISSYAVQTDAMSPTVDRGEFILAWKVFEPSRGDVVLLACPESETGTCIKRVVGVGGDRVEIVKQRLIVNGKSAAYEKIPSDSDQLILMEKTPTGARTITIDAKTPPSLDPVIVPPDHVFLLNDQRQDLSDSRKWGPVPILQVEARAWRIWMSMDWSKFSLRWRRMFRRID